jgi:hypothetical protein
MATTTILTRACLGCGAAMIYEDDGAPGTPCFEPIEENCVQYSFGHLCPPCSSATTEFLRKRRDERTTNHAAVVRGHP